ncbi:hypothetical protein [Mesorhizobium sp.]|uniref:hypothetical protein n=1 Tax=Mesorhizobium sp. TaxID=1871066 RepID=UPI0025E4F38D|nr:hypothetical protein [Mesorhizobium sp.]
MRHLIDTFQDRNGRGRRYSTGPTEETASRKRQKVYIAGTFQALYRDRKAFEFNQIGRGTSFPSPATSPLKDGKKINKIDGAYAGASQCIP